MQSIMIARRSAMLARPAVVSRQAQLRVLAFSTSARRLENDAAKPDTAADSARRGAQGVS